MNEIIRIHIAKVPFEIEISAKNELMKYLDDLKKYTDDDEILLDVEIRITEILQEQGINENQIISKQEIKKIKEQLGDAKVFSEGISEDNLNYSDDEESYGLTSSAEKVQIKQARKLYRDTENGVIGGVASGMGLFFNLDVVIIRIIMILFITFSLGWGSLVYIILWIAIPKAKTAGDILKTKGEKINAASLKEVNAEYDFTKNDIRNRKLLRVLGILCGIGFVIGAVLGIIMLITVNLILPNETYNMFSFGIILANVAGGIFVAFCGLIAYICFKQKTSIAQIIVLAIMAVTGLSVFSSAVAIESSNQGRLLNEARRNIRSEKIEVNKTDLSKVKSLSVNTNMKVEYIVDKEFKAEIIELKNDLQTRKLKLDFNDENLTINYDKDYIADTETEKIIIFGPSLESINVRFGSVIYKSKSQKMLNVKLNDNTSIEIPNRVEIDDFAISGGSSSEVLAGNVSAKNLKIRLDKYSTFSFNQADKTEIDLNYECYSGTPSAVNFKKNILSSVLINGEKFKNEKEQCIQIDIDHEISKEKK